MSSYQNTQTRINFLYNSLTEIRRNIAEIIRLNQSHASDEFHLNYDQRFMIDLYTSMYNTTLRQIDFLYRDLYFASQQNYFRNGAGTPSPHQNNAARNQPRNRNNNSGNRLPGLNDRNYYPMYQDRFQSQYTPQPQQQQQNIPHFPQNPPIPREDNINTLLSEAMRNLGFPDLTPVRVVPTPQQIAHATRTIRFGDVTNPPNSRCPIRLETFEPETLVTQIIYCRHCFHSEECEIWFQQSVRCPVCRYDVRTPREEPVLQPQANSFSFQEPALVQEEDDLEEIPTLIPTVEEPARFTQDRTIPVHNILSEENNIANLLTQTIGNIMANTNTQEFTFDASNSMIIYDAIFRGRN